MSIDPCRIPPGSRMFHNSFHTGFLDNWFVVQCFLFFDLFEMKIICHGKNIFIIYFKYKYLQTCTHKLIAHSYIYVHVTVYRMSKSPGDWLSPGSWFTHFLIIQLWVNYLSSLCPSVFHYKMVITNITNSQGCCEHKWENKNSANRSHLLLLLKLPWLY